MIMERKSSDEVVNRENALDDEEKNDEEIKQVKRMKKRKR
jgi:hypothetical protein